MSPVDRVLILWCKPCTKQFTKSRCPICNQEGIIIGWVDSISTETDEE